MRHGVLLALLLSGCAVITDGAYPYYDRECTHFPDITQRVSECCLTHDVQYRDQIGTRLESDEELRQCLLNTEAAPVADLVYWVVRWAGELWWGKE